MILRDPRFWIATFSLAGVFYLALANFQRTPPGELSAVHAREPELQGNSCSGCHGGWFQTMQAACMECHEDIGTQIEAGSGLHGVLGPEKANACALCHSEHHGGEFVPVNRQSFLQAGIPDAQQFDHTMIGFPMAGRHLELTCIECHEHADAQVLPQGGQRYLGLSQDCGTCHEDAHEGMMVIGCAKCHGQTAFDQLESRGHEKYLPLTGGHAGLSCRKCHEAEIRHSLEALGRGQTVQPRACTDCHDSPHDSDFVTGVARISAQTPPMSCAVCHEADHVSFRDEHLEVNPAQHAASGFRLDPPHDEVQCRDCHDPAAPDFHARHPGRSADGCRQCHQDPHGGQFDDSPQAPQDCISCHDRRHFDPHAFTVDKHAGTGFPLTGSHLDTDCHDCHELPLRKTPRVFRGTPSRCEKCHVDAHRGYFDRFAQLERVAAGTCAKCHATTTFDDLSNNEFDHEEWTGFAVLGAHAQAECEICHERDREADDTGRTFGRVEDLFGKHEGCFTCHQDPHRGEFDAPGFPKELDGRRDCARCHVETSFRVFPDGFDHRRWTGFPLQGAHKETACSSCHPPLAQADELGRTWERARGSNCSDCHSDSHGGQFDVAGRTDCRRCHRSATEFSELAFNHEIHSRFRLGEAHAKVPCSECHKPFRQGEREIIRYKPLKTECVDCHGTHDDPLRRRRGRDR